MAATGRAQDTGLTQIKERELEALAEAIGVMADQVEEGRRKLVLEISGLPPRIIPAANVFSGDPSIDCLIGEKASRSAVQP